MMMKNILDENATVNNAASGELIFEVDGDMYFNVSDIYKIVDFEYVVSVIESKGSEYLYNNGNVLFNKIMDSSDKCILYDSIVETVISDCSDGSMCYIDEDNNISIKYLEYYILEVFGRTMHAFDDNDIVSLYGHEHEYEKFHAFMHDDDEDRENVFFELDYQDILDIAIAFSDPEDIRKKIIASYMNGRNFE